jgi:hypothetical protein
MRLPGIWGEPRERDEAIRVLRRAVELGITFIDTAHGYGVSEELIREALHPYPVELVIVTKAGLARTGRPLGRPECLRQEAEMSLRRLGLERIELLQLHRIDPQVPLEEQARRLRRATAGGQGPPHRPVRGLGQTHDRARTQRPGGRYARGAIRVLEPGLRPHRFCVRFAKTGTKSGTKFGNCCLRSRRLSV